MSKHTPGPWEYCAIKTDQYDPHCGPYGAHEDCVKIGDRLLRISCFAYPGSFAGAEEIWEANARLIAASPEMLEALEMVLRVIDLGNAAGDSSDAFEQWAKGHEIMVEAVKSAIKKARGEE